MQFEAIRPSKNRAKTKGGSGLRIKAITLMELIGILAVITILAGIITPSIIKRIIEAKRTAETNDLYALAETLKSEILRQKRIPDPANWAEFLARNFLKPASEIHKSRRIMVVDPQISIGNGPLPFIQTTNGTSYPLNARIMFLSNLSLNTNNPAIPSDIGSDPVKFQAVWDTPDRAVPPGWSPAWQGKGENLKIQRLELSSLFCRLTIQVTSGSNAWISIDNSPPFPVPSTNRFYLKGTVVGLYSSGGTNLFQSEPLFDDTLYIFNGKYWTKDIDTAKESDTSSGSGTIAEIVDAFLSAPTNPDAKFGAAQKYLINDMYYYMLLYTRWANDGFQDYGAQNLEQLVDYMALLDLGHRGQGRIQRVSRNLLW